MASDFFRDAPSAAGVRPPAPIESKFGGLSVSEDLAVLERHFVLSRSALLSLSSCEWAGRHLTDEHMGAVCAVIAGNSQLEGLILSRNRITDSGAMLLAKALASSDSLRKLCLSGNRITDPGASALAEALPRMGWKRRSDADGKSGAGSLLEEVRLANNRIGDEGVTALAAALPDLSQLSRLDLRCNSMGEAGATALAAVLPKLHLQEIHLQRNRIGDVGAAAIATALPRTPWLRSLRLTGNVVGDAGASALAAALPKAPSLIGLQLSSNQLGDAGGVALARALPASAIERLEIAYHPSLADATAEALADLVPSSRLLALDVEGHGASDLAERSLAHALLSGAIFGVAISATEYSPLPLRRLHGVRLVSHVRALGVLSEELRDELDNGVLLDELRRHRGLLPETMQPSPPRPSQMSQLEKQQKLQMSKLGKQHRKQSATRKQARLPSGTPDEPDEAVRDLQLGEAGAARGEAEPARVKQGGETRTGTRSKQPPAAATKPTARRLGSAFRRVSKKKQQAPADDDSLTPSRTVTPSKTPQWARPWPNVAATTRPTGGASDASTPSVAAPAQASVRAASEADADVPVTPPPRARPDAEELLDAIQSVFDRWDVDRSGMLSLEEFRNGIATEARSPLYKDDPTVRLVTSAVQASTTTSDRELVEAMPQVT